MTSSDDIFTSPVVLTTLAITGVSGFLLGLWSTSALSRVSSNHLIKLAAGRSSNGNDKKSRKKSKKSSKKGGSSDSKRNKHSHENQSSQNGEAHTGKSSQSGGNKDGKGTETYASVVASAIEKDDEDGKAKGTQPGTNQLPDDEQDSEVTDVTDSEYDDLEEEEEDDDDPSLDAAPGAFEFTDEECKMVLVIRTDLEMTKGKVVAQCAHAAVACYKSIARSNPLILSRWERRGQAKITLKCRSEEELRTLQAMALSLDITARSIQDAGRTQVAPGTTTVLGLGPAPVSAINQVTGHLKLY